MSKKNKRLKWDPCHDIAVECLRGNFEAANAARQMLSATPSRRPTRPTADRKTTRPATRATAPAKPATPLPPSLLPAIVGFACVYGKQYHHCGIWETVAPGALHFGPEVVALFEHDFTKELGSTEAGNLQVFEHDHGLVFRLQPVNDRHGRELYRAAQADRIVGVSFATSWERSAVRPSYIGEAKTITAGEVVDVSLSVRDRSANPACYAALWDELRGKNSSYLHSSASWDGREGLRTKSWAILIDLVNAGKL